MCMAYNTGRWGVRSGAKSCEVGLSECGFWGPHRVKFPHSDNPVSQDLACEHEANDKALARPPVNFDSLKGII